MAQLIVNQFSQYSMSAEELRAGQMLSLPQEMVIQNAIGNICAQMINTPATNPDFQVQLSYLAGQRDILQYLLDTSKSATEGQSEVQDN